MARRPDFAGRHEDRRQCPRHSIQRDERRASLLVRVDQQGDRSGQFTRESLALIRNQAFVDYCESQGDAENARLYREIIQPDEEHHHELGRKLLLRYADTPERQEAARHAAAGTLRLAEEIQETARLRRGISRAPGC